MNTTTETPTLAPISRAEAVRRFKGAHTYALISRTHPNMAMPPTRGAGVRRTIERVTSSGVYIAGTPWAVTRLDEGTWTADGSSLALTLPDGIVLTYALDPEIPAPAAEIVTDKIVRWAESGLVTTREALEHVAEIARGED